MESIEKIREEIKNASFSHAYLMIGFSDSELNEVLLSFTNVLGLREFDIVEVAPPEESGKKGEIKIDLIKDALHRVNLSSLNYKICVIKKCNRLNATSANALLKILEEAPKNVIFLLSSESEQVMATIRSRCRIYKNNPKQSHTLSYDEVLIGSLSEAFSKIDEVVKDGKEKEFIAWVEAKCQSDLCRTVSREQAELVILIEKVRKRLNNNINLRLNLENLVLRLRQKNE